MLGLGASDEDIDRAAGINVKLWTGLAMLLVAGLFLAWAFSRPVGEEMAEPESEPAGARSGSDGDRPEREDRAGAQQA